MAIVFGKRFKHVGTQQTDILCSHCQEAYYSIHLFRGYAHIFWIPVFPMGRLAVVSCPHCKWNEDTDTIAKHIASKPDAEANGVKLFKDLKKRARTPWYLWSGLAIALAICGGAAVAEQTNNQAIAEWVAHPEGHCMLVVKSTDSQDRDYPYRVVYVDSIKEGKVTIRISLAAYSQYRGADKAVKKQISELRAGNAGQPTELLEAMNLDFFSRLFTVEAIHRL